MNEIQLQLPSGEHRIVDHGSVKRLEDALLAMPQADIKTEHKFYAGTYERTITIPPWTVLTGAVHRTPYMVRLERGTIAVNTDDGIKILTAPCEFQAPSGVKRVGRVFGDEVVWTDIYDNPDNEVDIATLEERLYEIPDCGLGSNRIALEIERDHNDFQLFLGQLGWSQDEMDRIVRTDDLMPMPSGFDVEVRDSRIHGKGLFALKSFAYGEVICPGRIDGKRTPAGRYINHSPVPNAVARAKGDDIDAVALRAIHAGEEVVIDYRGSMRVNWGIEMQGEMPCQVG